MWYFHSLHSHKQLCSEILKVIYNWWIIWLSLVLWLEDRLDVHVLGTDMKVLDVHAHHIVSSVMDYSCLIYSDLK